MSTTFPHVDQLDTVLDHQALAIHALDTELEDALETITDVVSLEEIDPTIRTRISVSLTAADERRWLDNL